MPLSFSPCIAIMLAQYLRFLFNFKLAISFLHRLFLSANRASLANFNGELNATLGFREHVMSWHEDCALLLRCLINKLLLSLLHVAHILPLRTSKSQLMDLTPLPCSSTQMASLLHFRIIELVNLGLSIPEQTTAE